MPAMLLGWISAAAAGTEGGATAASPAYDLLKLRDPVGCEALGTPSDALRDELIRLTDPAVLPGSVPVKAADCLVALFPTDPVAGAAWASWPADPERAGLALILLNHVDTLPVAAAVDVLRAAKASPSARVQARARATIEASRVPEIVQLKGG